MRIITIQNSDMLIVDEVSCQQQHNTLSTSYTRTHMHTHTHKHTHAHTYAHTHTHKHTHTQTYKHTKVRQVVTVMNTHTHMHTHTHLYTNSVILCVCGWFPTNKSGGSGFCVYADITLSIQHLRRDFPDRVKTVLIVDLDAHQVL